MDAIAARYRELFLDVLAPLADAPLMLSGGVDSATILAGLLVLGKRPDCFTLQLGEQRSADVAVAEQMVRAFGVPYHLVRIERSDAQLLADVRRMIDVLQTTAKCCIQCGQGAYHLALAVRAFGADVALTGTGSVVEDNRECAVILHTQGEEAARAYRRRTAVRAAGDVMDGTKAMHVAALAAGVRMLEVYSREPLLSYALALDMAEINRPVQKGLALRAFPEFWSAGKFYRENSSMQVNAGIREWHDTLLRSEYNKRGARAVVAVYNDIREDMQHGRWG